MEDLQNFQDCTNENIERLKEKLEELNLNNNKVSFDEYDTEEIPLEKPIKQRKKIKKKIVSSEDENEEHKEPIQKPK